ncbi:MAG: NAD(P)/FAD-dependent oxidoreductase [Myxococcota bacterium]
MTDPMNTDTNSETPAEELAPHPGFLALADLPTHRFDVVICGGGLAGLTLARQLRREQPELSVMVAERTTRPIPESAFKVGESSVEMGSQYLERLGLRDYLVEHHLFKFGLRFFAGGGHLPIDERPEIGPAQEPIVPSYQLDRGCFESDLRGMLQDENDVTLVEGTKVGEVILSEDESDHEIELSQDGVTARVKARWVVDATGRASLFRKRKKLTRGTKHPANASWFRIEGKLDITEMVPADHKEWHDVEWAPHRWRSTNHFMGPGYWAWVIPLGSGNTSIGLVAHDSHVPFDELRSLDRTLEFLGKNEPYLLEAVQKHKILDFRCLKNYSHNTARSWSAERWAIVGEAGAFADPLYSPGTDFIGLANSFTEEMIRQDANGASTPELVERARELSAIYRSLIGGAVDLYREAAPVYGHAPALVAKIFWDNFVYWSYPCQLFQQNLYKLSGEPLMEMMPMGERFSDITRRMQTLFAAWAELAPVEPKAGFIGMPGFPSVLIDTHLALQNKWSPEETLEQIRARLVEGEEIAVELVLRAMDEVGPEHVAELLDRVKIHEWNLDIADARIAATETVGLARRRALRPLAKDVERTLGRAPHNLDEAAVRKALAGLIGASEPLAQAGAGS